ncbi:MAG: DEAD/DEAH box helicase [Candidatus Bathyarchaeota archaeon]|nr:DEAD/DEAH box helicase [Candidatus Bathyarchaeota archaeon]
MRILEYSRGRIIIEGDPVYLDQLEPMNSFPAHMYNRIIEHLDSSREPYRDRAGVFLKTSKLETTFKLRDYQIDALKYWTKADCRGIVVLPTGSGKTVLAVKAIEEQQCSTLVVVPTIVLVEQWRQVLQQAFNTPVGALGGGQEDIEPITVSTYDSARLRAHKLGNVFKLIIFDEVHHLTSPSNRRIAERYLAPKRLGLTATLQKAEAPLMILEELVGPTVYELGVTDLAGSHLADFTVKTIRLPLSGAEQYEYNRQYDIYRDYLKSRNIQIRSPRDYLNFVKRSGRDPEARRALTARNAAMDIALNSSSKIAYLKQLLKSNPTEKTLIFTSHNKLVYTLSKELLVPAITHQTPQEEREEILSRFHSGDYKRVLTSRVLDEGVDVPDASMAVILSGSGSNRQFVQRLGRILRPSPGKEAILFELVSAGTAEVYMSHRRKQR